MITTAKHINDPTWLNGMIYNVEIRDRFGRYHRIYDHVIGTTFNYELKDPYREIKWTNHYLVLLIGQTKETVYKDISDEFDNLEDALNFMWDHNDSYEGQIHQTRILSNGKKDTCCVTYNSHLYKGGKESTVIVIPSKKYGVI